jgi:hypothetical protein
MKMRASRWAGTAEVLDQSHKMKAIWAVFVRWLRMVRVALIPLSWLSVYVRITECRAYCIPASSWYGMA